MSTLDDKALKAQSGDEDSYTDIVNDMTPLLRKIASHIAGSNEALRDDLTADGIFSLVRSVPTWDQGKGKFATYAATCARREMLSSLRKEMRHSRLRSDADVAPFALAEDDNDEASWEDLAEHSHAAMIASDIIEDSKEQNKRIIEMVLSGVPLDDIADEINERPEDLKKKLKGIVALIASGIDQVDPSLLPEGFVAPVPSPTPLADSLLDTLELPDSLS